MYGQNQVDTFLNPPRWSGYSTVQEDLSITVTDPSQSAAWKSPSQEVISENSDLSKYFDYTTNPGSVTYVGVHDIIVKCEANVSADSSENNTSIRLKWVKNGNPVDQPTRYISDKITTARSEAVLPCSRTFKLSTGDYLDFYFGADKVCTLSLYKSEYNITTIAILEN